MKLLIFETAKNNQASSARWQKGQFVTQTLQLHEIQSSQMEGSTQSVINIYSYKNID